MNVCSDSYKKILWLGLFLWSFILIPVQKTFGFHRWCSIAMRSSHCCQLLQCGVNTVLANAEHLLAEPVQFSFGCVHSLTPIDPLSTKATDQCRHFMVNVLDDQKGGAQSSR